ncbi:hypothetical protein LAZ40_04380 [Cereibacter sphaeroides]|uniref:hypothetical protein n=1 Tax=Cereibacter sphaeroides TaxID=1063 RepID=UPI001F1ADB3F|nr:hypothetical protein [Cereibacter sphaeroides]MCE6958292.1 hypothetical protein [Cereibacter sphaeroides]MCE6971902.1 hypothetical protein [Cereibacter sphaeroides]
MALHLPPDSTFEGIPAEEVQAFLRERMDRWRSEDPVRFDTAGCLDERSFEILDSCEAHGLVRDEAGDSMVYRILPEGEAVSRAKLRDRVPLAEAEAVLAQLLDRMSDLEVRSPVRFRGLWLFGSVMRREPMVGDIDAVIDFDLEGGRSDPQTRAFLAVEKRKEDYFGEEAMLERLLCFSDHPLLDGVVFDDFELRFMRAPCRRLEKVDGTWAWGPVLERHPNADPGEAAERPQVRIRCDQGWFFSAGSCLEPDAFPFP